MKEKRSNLPPEDDGRTIADMNVEGMPWYVDKKRRDENGRLQLTPAESRAVIGGVLKAALLVAGAFALMYLACLLVGDLVWVG